MKELHTPSAPSYTLHRFPEKQPGVFLGMCEQPSTQSASLVCLISLALSLTPTCLAQLTEALSKHKHLSLRMAERKLLYLPHHIHFSLSIKCLVRSYCFLIVPPSLPSTHLPSLSLSEFLPSLFYLSHASLVVFSG